MSIKKFHRMKEKNSLLRSSYESFGRHLLKSVAPDVNSDDINYEEIISKYVRNWGSGPRTTPGLMYINWKVSTYFGEEPLNIRNTRTRKREIIKVKHTAIYLAVIVYGYTYEKIADFYHLKTHGAIINALKNVRNYMFTDDNFKEQINDLTNKLLGYYDETKNQRASTVGSLENLSEAGNFPSGDNLPQHWNGKIESSD